MSGSASATKRGFSAFLKSDPQRLHVAAHSHHPWPDVSFEGQQQAWHDAAQLMDGKWERVFGQVLPQAQAWIARALRLSDPATLVFAPNTHELLVRMLSCFEPPVRILTTDGEFASFERQVRRLSEDGLVQVTRVPVAPAPSLGERLAGAAAAGGYDVLFFSQVLFGTGVVVGDIAAIVAAVADDRAFVVIDGYHGFMALPTDLSAIAGRAFYLAGGYKYAMAGEGVCFAHCPPGFGPRPRDTGWYADAGAMQGGEPTIAYPTDGRRFFGATFDPSGLYRFNAVQRWLSSMGWTVAEIHRHVVRLQRRFLAGLAQAPPGPLDFAALVAGPDSGTHGHLLAFDHPQAAAVEQMLAGRHVVVDHRGSRVRVGFGIYHDTDDIDHLLDRLQSAP